MLPGTSSSSKRQCSSFRLTSDFTNSDFRQLFQLAGLSDSTFVQKNWLVDLLGADQVFELLQAA